MNFIGALMSEKVAMTIASGLVDYSATALALFLQHPMGAIVWDPYLVVLNPKLHFRMHLLAAPLVTIIFAGRTGHILWAGVLEKVVIPSVTFASIGMAPGLLYYETGAWDLCWLATLKRQIGLFRSRVFLSCVYGIQNMANDVRRPMGITLCR